MFFSITDFPDEKFPYHVQLGSLYLNTDAGWTVKNHDEVVVYKGYIDNGNIEHELDTIITTTLPAFSGNYCVIHLHNGVVSIKHNIYRSFPLYYQAGKIVTNLEKQDKLVWGNGVIKVDPDLNIEYTKFNPIGEVDTGLLDEEAVLDKVYNLIDTTISNFLTHNQLPLRIFLSGGVDSMLVYSFIKKHTDNVELLTYEHQEFDEFYLKNIETLRKTYWHYNQIHHWRTPCVLVSGAPGDEYTLRNPTIGNLFLMHHGTSIPEQLTDPNLLHYTYLNRQKNLESMNRQLSDQKMRVLVKNRTVLWKYLCDLNINDHQHWHLGNTLTFTPLRNLEIFKLMLQLPYKSALSQILDSGITKKLIARNDPKLLDYISNQKNTNPFENMWPLLKNFV